MTTYHISYQCVAEITDLADGTAQMKVSCCGKTLMRRVYKSRKNALTAWNRFCR